MNAPRAFRRRGAVAMALLMACCALPAKPAPWYYWRSKVDGKRVCAQVSPGPGWTRDSGPYDGAMCQPRRRVFVLPAK